MRTKFNVKAVKCASANGRSYVRYCKPQAAKLWSVFVGAVCIGYGLGQGLASECVNELSQHGQQAVMRVME